MSEKTSVEEKLRRFLDKAKELPSDAEKNGDACYETLYHIRLMCKALGADDKNIANTLYNWLAENKEKFRFCATDDDFDRVTADIELFLNRIIDEDATGEDIAGKKSNGPDLGRYLSDLANSEIIEKKIEKKFLRKSNL
jgi:hypothetical protein